MIPQITRGLLAVLFRPRWVAAVGAHACSLALAVGCTSTTAGEPPDVIITAKGLPIDDTQPAMARVRGIITVRGVGAFFIQDDTAGLLATGDPHSLGFDPDRLVPGTEVVVTGTIGRGGFAPMLHLATIEIVGTRPLPSPATVERSRFFSGGYDGMLVEVEGIFEGGRMDGGTLVLALESDGREFEAHAPADVIGDDVVSFVGATVRIRGLALPVYNTRGEIIRPLIDILSRDGFAVVSLPSAGPFTCQKVPLDSLARYRPQPFEDRMVRIAGTVVDAVADGVIHLQDGVCGVVVKPQLSDPLRPGDRVEAAGFVDSSGRVAGLEQAFVKRIATGPAPEPLTVTPDEIVAVNEAAADSGQMAVPGDYDGCLIRFTGELVEARPTPDGGTLMVRAGGTSVTAVTRATDFRLLSRLPPGATLDIVGIARTEWSDGPGSRFARPVRRIGLIVRSATDVRLVRPPPWWTARRIAAVLAAVVLAALAGGVAAATWILVLRRQVRSQLAVIETSLRTEAVVEERRRIAREFHDSLQQELAGLALRLDSARSHFAEPEVVAEMNDQRSLLSRIQSETRQFVWNLREPARSHLPFGEVLSEQCREQAGMATVPVECVVEDPEPCVPQAARYALLRITGEAVANAVRHASASCVRVALGASGGPTRLDITDDGTGFDLAASESRPGHFGIRGMRERARRLGAAFSIMTAPNAGTRITVVLEQAATDRPSPRRGGSAEVPMPSETDGVMIAPRRPPAAAEPP